MTPCQLGRAGGVGRMRRERPALVQRKMVGQENGGFPGCTTGFEHGTDGIRLLRTPGLEAQFGNRRPA